ncbi:MAG: hypothetical protein LBQ08_04995 [Holosporaceae bacterium]|nr:hypothetical protein [Holosporaceae bacterium]
MKKIICLSMLLGCGYSESMNTAPQDRTVENVKCLIIPCQRDEDGSGILVEGVPVIVRLKNENFSSFILRKKTDISTLREYKFLRIQESTVLTKNMTNEEIIGQLMHYSSDAICIEDLTSIRRFFNQLKSMQSFECQKWDFVSPKRP